MEGNPSGIEVVTDTYAPEQDRTLTEAVLDAIEECMGADLVRSHFAVFEDIDQGALNEFFRNDAKPRTTVTISTPEVEIELRGNDGVEIRVEDTTAE